MTRFEKHSKVEHDSFLRHVVKTSESIVTLLRILYSQTCTPNAKRLLNFFELVWRFPIRFVKSSYKGSIGVIPRNLGNVHQFHI